MHKINLFNSLSSALRKIININLKLINNKFYLPAIRRKLAGFSLIEILISLFFIATLGTILFAATGTLLTRRRSDLQSVAAQLAAAKVDSLRNRTFADLRTSGLDNTCESVENNGTYKL